MNAKWSLKGKKALVTGATKGIGLAIAEEFLQHGADIFILARSQDEIDSKLKEWTAKGFSADGIACDVQSEQDRKRVIQSLYHQKQCKESPVFVYFVLTHRLET